MNTGLSGAGDGERVLGVDSEWLLLNVWLRRLDLVTLDTFHPPSRPLPQAPTRPLGCR